MTIEEKLLGWKKELTELTSKIDREKGSLDSIYINLAEKLGLKGKASTKHGIEKLAKKKLKSLSKDYKAFNEELTDLVEEIETDLNAFEEEKE